MIRTTDALAEGARAKFVRRFVPWVGMNHSDGCAVALRMLHDANERYSGGDCAVVSALDHGS